MLKQKLGEWKAPGEHRILNLEPREIVLFVPFIQHGLGLPACPFLHGFLHYYGITLNHLNPNSILHLSIFQFLFISMKLSLASPIYHSFPLFFLTKTTPERHKYKYFGGCRYSIPCGEEERVCPLYLGGFFKELEGRVVLCGEHVPP